MPLYDFECTSCSHKLINEYLASYSLPNPICPKCSSPTEKLWTSSHSYTPFKSFIFEVDGNAINIDSIEKLRKIERDSEHDFKTGNGRPYLFRAFSQDRSNRDKPLFEDSPEQKEVYRLQEALKRPKTAKISVHNERYPGDK